MKLLFIIVSCLATAAFLRLIDHLTKQQNQNSAEADGIGHYNKYNE